MTEDYFIEANDKQCIDDFLILSRYWLQNYDILNVYSYYYIGSMEQK